MTLEEAKALILRESMMTEPVPDDAVPIALHEGHMPAADRINRLIEAIDMVHESIEDDFVINRKMAGALWIIGVEANSAMGSERQPAEQDNLISLVTAVESALVGFWTEGHPRDKEGAEESPSGSPSGSPIIVGWGDS